MAAQKSTMYARVFRLVIYNYNPSMMHAQNSFILIGETSPLVIFYSLACILFIRISMI